MATTTVEKDIIDLERRYWQAMKECDVDTAVSLTDFPCVVAGSHGVRQVEKEAFTQMMKSSKDKIRDVKIGDDICVRILGDGIAIVAYTVQEQMVVDGKSVVIDAADCSTWVRREGRWVCALHSETVLQKPSGQGNRAKQGAPRSSNAPM